MNYSVVSYLTDSTEIKKVYGSKNKALLATLLEHFSDELDTLNEDFKNDLDKNENAQEILKDIINGEIRFPEIAFMYGYVYEKICDYYGELVLPPNDELSTGYYWDVPKQTYKAFIPIPFSDDFPEVFSIQHTDLKTNKERFLALFDREDVDEETFRIEKEDFEFIFNQAMEENKDLVFFLY